MCSRKLELRSIVPFQRIGGNLEPIVVVAFRTVRRLAVHREFTLVNLILVAIRTPTMLERFGHIARFVALLAFQLAVHTQ